MDTVTWLGSIAIFYLIIAAASVAVIVAGEKGMLHELKIWRYVSMKDRIKRAIEIIRSVYRRMEAINKRKSRYAGQSGDSSPVIRVTAEGNAYNN